MAKRQVHSEMAKPVQNKHHQMMESDSSMLTGTQHLPGLSVFQRSATLRSLLSGVPMGPKLEKGTELWLWVGGELGKLLGLEE